MTCHACHHEHPDSWAEPFCAGCGDPLRPPPPTVDVDAIEEWTTRRQVANARKNSPAEVAVRHIHTLAAEVRSLRGVVDVVDKLAEAHVDQQPWLEAVAIIDAAGLPRDAEHRLRWAACRLWRSL